MRWITAIYFRELDGKPATITLARFVSWLVHNVMLGFVVLALVGITTRDITTGILLSLAAVASGTAVCVVIDGALLCARSRPRLKVVLTWLGPVGLALILASWYAIAVTSRDPGLLLALSVPILSFWIISVIAGPENIFPIEALERLIGQRGRMEKD